MRYFINRVFIFTLAAAAVQMAWAGAWTREEGETYSKISFLSVDSDQTFGPKGNNKLDGPDYDESTLAVYSEYGFSPNWTGIVSFSHKTVESSTTGARGSESGLADAWFLLKRRLLVSPVVLSAQVGAKIPLGYDREHLPPLGDGQEDYEFRLLAGRSIGILSGYANAELGYRRRSGDLSDELPFVLEAGIFPIRRLLVKGLVEGVSNLGNDRASDLGVTLGPNIFEEEYTKAGAALIVFLDRGFSVEVSYDSVIAGGNTSLSNTLGIGLSWQGKLRKD